MLERIRRVGDLRGLPKVQYQSPQHFFWQLEKDAEASAVQKDGGFVDDAAPAYVTGAQSAVSGATAVTASDPLFAPRPAAMPPPIGGGLPKWVGELYCEKRRMLPPGFVLHCSPCLTQNRLQMSGIAAPTRRRARRSAATASARSASMMQRCSASRRLP